MSKFFIIIVATAFYHPCYGANHIEDGSFIPSSIQEISAKPKGIVPLLLKSYQDKLEQLRQIVFGNQTMGTKSDSSIKLNIPPVIEEIYSTK